MRKVGFIEGFTDTCANVMGEATLPMHLLNLCILVTYPVVWCGVWCVVTVRDRA